MNQLEFERDINHNYTFIHPDSKQQVGYGSYGKDGFTLVTVFDQYIRVFPSAAVAWSNLNTRLKDLCEI